MHKHIFYTFLGKKRRKGLTISLANDNADNRQLIFEQSRLPIFYRFLTRWARPRPYNADNRYFEKSGYIGLTDMPFLEKIQVVFIIYIKGK